MKKRDDIKKEIISTMKKNVTCCLCQEKGKEQHISLPVCVLSLELYMDYCMMAAGSSQ